ncbi:MAG: hypothetical protein JNM98_18950 [Rhodocyclaceae bacterium]|nr:hypothetical protein [Rhodocyclaceae bacterium]
MLENFMKMAQESARQMQTTHARLLQGTSPALPGLPAQALAGFAPVQKLNAYQGIAQNLMAQQAQLVQDLWTLATQPGTDFSLASEMLQLQQALFERIAKQQADAMRELMGILNGATHMRSANTMSKLLEEESDFFAQLHALMSAQATAYLELAETAQVNAGYLVARKVAGADK